MISLELLKGIYLATADRVSGDIDHGLALLAVYDAGWADGHNRAVEIGAQIDAGRYPLMLVQMSEPQEVWGTDEQLCNEGSLIGGVLHVCVRYAGHEYVHRGADLYEWAVTRAPEDSGKP